MSSEQVLSNNHVAGGRMIDPLAPATDHPGHAHYEALKSRFIDTKPQRALLNTDLDRAGGVLIGVKKTIDELDLMKVLRKLDKVFYDAERANDMARYGWILRYIAFNRARETAALDERLLPEKLVTPAEQLRARMYKVAAYHLGETAEHGGEIAAIEEGRGYQDLARDLMRLAVLYKNEGGRMAGDGQYRAGDVEQAKAYYLEITELLAANVSTPWGAVGLKAFSFVEREYWHLRQTVAWVWREQEEMAAKFPSLFPRSKVSARSSDADADETEEVIDEGAPTTPVAVPVIASPVVA